MQGNIRKFSYLPSQQKNLFVEAYFTLGFYRIAVLIRSFKSLVSELDHNESSVEVGLTTEKKQLALLIGKAITTAANHTPWESACLVQALTAQRMLRKRKIPGMFHIGATMNSAENDPLAAHAWLICGDEILTGKSGHEQYAILKTYSWE